MIPRDELVKLLIGDVDIPFPKAYLNISKQEFIENGFEIVEEAETYRPIAVPTDAISIA